MAAKKSDASKKMNTQRMSSISKSKMTPSIDGGKTIPPSKKLKKKTN